MADIDPTLIAAARAGDRRALDTLLTQLQPHIYRFGLKMCGDRDAAQDVLQETLAAMAQHLDTFRGDASLSTWLFTIARRFCMKKRRTRKHAPRDTISLDSPGAPTPASLGVGADDTVLQKERTALVDGALAALEPKLREVVLLRDIEGLPAAEVATVLGLSVAATKSRLHRGRLQLRQALAPAMGLPPGGEAAPESTCPDVLTLLSAHEEGDVTAAQCAEMERHIETCSACRARCTMLRETLALCRTQSAAAVPLEVQDAVRLALKRTLGGAPTSPTG